MKGFVFRAFLFFTIFGAWSYYRLDGFTLEKVLKSKLQEACIDTKPSQEMDKIRSFLDQKFTYFAKGHQCFVFLSEDKKYVLKLINHGRFNLPVWVYPLTFLPYFKDIKKRRDARKEPSFKSYLLAYEKLQNETGIVYVQIKQTDRFSQFIHLVDNIGVAHKLDLHKVEFILQKKVEPIYLRLEKLWKLGKYEEFRQALTAFLENISSRVHKCIIDDDLDVCINYGYLDSKAILIDPGRLAINLELNDPKMRKKEMYKATKYIRRWLQEKFPGMLLFFENKLDELAHS